MLHAPDPSDQTDQATGSPGSLITRRNIMAKRRRARKKRKITKWNRHFGTVAKQCFAKGPTSGKELGRCMKSSL